MALVEQTRNALQSRALNWKWIWKWVLIGTITLMIGSNLIGSYAYMKSQGGYYEVNNVECTGENPQM